MTMNSGGHISSKEINKTNCRFPVLTQLVIVCFLNIRQHGLALYAFFMHENR